MLSCKKDKVHEEEPFKPEFLNYGFTSIVNINNTDVLKYIKATEKIIDGISSRFSLNMISSDENYNYYYPINFNLIRLQTGVHTLHSIGLIDTINSIYYDKICCSSNPDAVYWNYVTVEDDSINNYISIHVDTVNLSISGSFKAMMIHANSFVFDGPDTVRLSCDTFNCSYSKEFY